MAKWHFLMISLENEQPLVVVVFMVKCIDEQCVTHITIFNKDAQHHDYNCQEKRVLENIYLA